MALPVIDPGYLAAGKSNWVIPTKKWRVQGKPKANAQMTVLFVLLLA